MDLMKKSVVIIDIINGGKKDDMSISDDKSQSFAHSHWKKCQEGSI